ncbi:hypothetical protein [Sphingomonas sp. DBB INV C78]|uniref:hypothetical protein n=1 Tax=Sphingomonas sp. DBB INV C78 TaxID=3349434 RepID=UPI0036D35152
MLLAAVTAWVGYQAVVFSIAGGLPNSQIKRAYAMAPHNGRIAARLSEVLSGADATPADRARADRLAREALRDDATAVKAVATLGNSALFRNQPEEARRWFEYSQRLSRRDLRTQIWAIEDAVLREDIPSALHHYDIALRVHRRANDLLFPVLVAAISEPTIRIALTKTLARQPLWTNSFIDFASRNRQNPEVVAALFRNLLQVGVPVSDGATASILDALIAGGNYDVAWAYYAVVRPGVDRAQSRDPNLSANLEVPSSLDWVPLDRTGISASLQRAGDRGVFDFAAVSTVGGPVLQQLQILPPGDYVIEGHSIGISQAENARPYWTLSCRNGKELGRVNMPNSAVNAGRFGGSFTVSDGCPVQLLMLTVRSSNEISGSTGQIDRVLLHPAVDRNE